MEAIWLPPRRELATFWFVAIAAVEIKKLTKISRSVATQYLWVLSTPDQARVTSG